MFEGKLPNLGGGVSNSSFQGEEGAAARILSRLDLDIPCESTDKFRAVISPETNPADQPPCLL
jgi:hypothetical protein